MVHTIKKWFKQLFCLHDYDRVEYCPKFDTSTGFWYSLRRYRCSKCGKEIWVDGRNDPYARGGHRW